MNPSTAFGAAFADELARCGLREAVVAPGSRSTPLAMALHDLDRAGRLRLHVRIDERSASFTALGLAKASRRPVAVLCTSGTAAANFHPAVIEASESGVPLLVLTADRPPELRAAGASQTIDQVKLYGGAVRWFADAGVPETRPGAVGYWRSLACQAWAHAAGEAGTFPGPVHVNLPFRDPLVPDGDTAGWPEPLDGRPDGRPWTRFTRPGTAADLPELPLPWAERGIVVCGDGDYDAAPLLELAERAGWPVLAEPSSGARRGPNALTGYQYLLASKAFMAAHRPEVIVSAGRPGLSRPQSALLALARAGEPVRHVVVTQGPGHWADPQRVAADVAPAIRLTGAPGTPGGWLGEWRRADEAALRAAQAVLDEEEPLSEPRLAQELVQAIPDDALLWVGSSMPVRDIDVTMAARADVRVLASRGASGIDGTVSSAIGAALAHGGPAFALIGDLAFLHDSAGLVIGPGEPRPDLCLVVVNNDGGGIFAGLEQAAFPGVFERVFGTPHGASLSHLAAAFGVPYALAEQPGDLVKAVSGSGLRVVEARTDGPANAELRARMRVAATGAAEKLLRYLEVRDRPGRQRLRVGHVDLVATEVPGVVDGRQVRSAGAGRRRRGGRGEVALHLDQVHRRVTGNRRLVPAAREIHRPVVAQRGDVDPLRMLVAVAPGQLPGDLRQLHLGRRGHAPRDKRGPARGKAGEGKQQYGGKADRGAAGGRQPPFARRVHDPPPFRFIRSVRPGMYTLRPGTDADCNLGSAACETAHKPSPRKRRHQRGQSARHQAMCRRPLELMACWILLANCGSCRGSEADALQAGCPGSVDRVAVVPGAEPDDVDGGRGGEVLQAGLSGPR
jgi:2-succinyl-5-enolpyruvyl-6-hydroxy-3-cyclohexene-1-carboxylate synthase